METIKVDFAPALPLHIFAIWSLQCTQAPFHSPSLSPEPAASAPPHDHLFCFCSSCWLRSRDLRIIASSRSWAISIKIKGSLMFSSPCHSKPNGYSDCVYIQWFKASCTDAARRNKQRRHLYIYSPPSICILCLQSLLRSLQRLKLEAQVTSPPSICSYWQDCCYDSVWA